MARAAFNRVRATGEAAREGRRAAEQAAAEQAEANAQSQLAAPLQISQEDAERLAVVAAAGIEASIAALPQVPQAAPLDGGDR